VIKHGPIHPFRGKGLSASHLDPIKDFVTRGIADAKEKIVLKPMACDVKGAKRYNGQQCVIAKALHRTLKPEAVAVGRSLAYAVFRGLAIRFRLPAASRQLVEEFDTKGRARSAPVELLDINPTWRLKNPGRGESKPRKKSSVKRARTKKYGVRAVGGGVA
jgi:hypothetical protein